MRQVGLVYFHNEVVGLPDLLSTLELPSRPCCGFVSSFWLHGDALYVLEDPTA